MASGDRQDRVGRVTRKCEQRRDETEGAAVARKHTQRYGEKLGRFASLLARPRVGYLYESESVAIHCTLRRDRIGGKGKG